jgi:uncharacterized SAM-binding protein YcdF (DUF218 family)
MAQTLSQDFATPVKWQEGNSVDTVENAEKSRAILEPEHIDTVVLVTDVVHMSRAMRDFQAAGFTPIAAPVGYAVSASLSWQSFLPDPNAYMRSSAVLRELLGLGWLRLVNWIGTWHMPFSD